MTKKDTGAFPNWESVFYLEGLCEETIKALQRTRMSQSNARGLLRTAQANQAGL